MKNVVIVEAKRTPIGSFGGSLSTLTAPELAAEVIKKIFDSTGIDPEQVDEVVIGNVLTAGVGQAPARQAALKSGLPEKQVYHRGCTGGIRR